MKKVIALLVALGVLGGCTGSNTELPGNKGVGTDHMRDSPCVCDPLDYKAKGYKWIG